MRAGAERLKGWQGRKLDGWALWGLHDSACAELAEGAALCVEALHTFGIELAGRAAAKAASLPADNAFSSIADYLRTKVCICMTCWHHFLQQGAKAYSYPAMCALQALILS